VSAGLFCRAFAPTFVIVLVSCVAWLSPFSAAAALNFSPRRETFVADGASRSPTLLTLAIRATRGFFPSFSSPIAASTRTLSSLECERGVIRVWVPTQSCSAQEGRKRGVGRLDFSRYTPRFDFILQSGVFAFVRLVVS